MKKFLIGISVLMLALAMVACGGTSDDTAAVDGGAEAHIHNFVDELVKATCVSEGRLVSKCECGEIYSETVLPIAPHTYPEVDCEKDTICTVCGQFLAAKTGHKLYNIEVVVPATCEAEGMTRAVCELCGKTVDTVLPVTHEFNKIERTANGYSATCGSCSRKIEGIKATELHNEATSGLTYNNGKISLLGGGSGDTYSYMLPTEVIGADKAPYQIEFTLTFDKGTGTSNGMENINNGGSGRHLLKFADTSYSILRQYPVSDGFGGWITTEILVGSMIDFSADPVPLIRMKVGESARFTFVIDPETEDVDIYVNDSFVATREKAAKVFSAKSAKMTFGDNSLRTAKIMGWTVSDISILRADEKVG